MRLTIWSATAGFGVLAATAALAAPAGDDAAARAAWGTAMRAHPAHEAGCFAAAYPSTAWTPVACTVAPNRPYLPKHGFPKGYTVGNGHDFAAGTSTLTSAATGSFTSVTGLRSERNGGQPNTYSLQLNSDFMHTAACNGGGSGCLSWLQFVYSTSSGAAFMQYWLINYGNRCPDRSWNFYQGSCYKNSVAVGVPGQALSALGALAVSGSAAAGGQDTLVLTTPSNAYQTNGPDSVVDLGTAWRASEYNVIGDGGGSAAVFNRGTSITVNIALQDGSSAAPTCEANAGTTGETNNLNLGSCSASGGSTPSITFTEHN